LVKTIVYCFEIKVSERQIPKKSRQGIEKMYGQKSQVLMPLGRGIAKYPDKSFLKGLYKKGESLREWSAADLRKLFWLGFTLALNAL
jgi:hypothetical protein